MKIKKKRAQPVHDHVYISGPMTGLPHNNVTAFNRAAKILRKCGLKVVNPAELDQGEPKALSWAQSLRRNLRALVTKCCAVVALPGWKASKGASLEVHAARQLGMPIVEITWGEGTDTPENIYLPAPKSDNSRRKKCHT